MEEEVFYCDNCGAEVKDDDKECPECGLVFESDVPLYCENCGEEVSIVDTECPNCGLIFEEDEETSEFETDLEDGVIYSIKGSRGRSIKVYENKCIINVKVGLGSLVTGNVTDGEKTIYYKDVIGVQFKPSKLTLGYLQLETASISMNNISSNFFNENTFTYDPTKISNEDMEEVYKYVNQKVEEYKNNQNTNIKQISPADEIKKYKELLDCDAITKEEYEKKKKELLNL